MHVHTLLSSPKHTKGILTHNTQERHPRIHIHARIHTHIEHITFTRIHAHTPTYSRDTKRDESAQRDIREEHLRYTHPVQHTTEVPAAHTCISHAHAYSHTHMQTNTQTTHTDPLCFHRVHTHTWACADIHVHAPLSVCFRSFCFFHCVSFKTLSSFLSLSLSLSLSLLQPQTYKGILTHNTQERNPRIQIHARIHTHIAHITFTVTHTHAHTYNRDTKRDEYLHSGM